MSLHIPLAIALPDRRSIDLASPVRSREIRYFSSNQPQNAVQQNPTKINLGVRNFCFSCKNIISIIIFGMITRSVREQSLALTWSTLVEGDEQPYRPHW